MQNGVKDTLKENSVAKNTQADKVEQTVKDAQKAADSAVVSETAGINKINNSDLNKDAVVSDAGKLGKAADEKQAETVNFNLDNAALQGLSKEGSANLAKLFNTSLAVANEGTENQNINTNPKNESKPVTTWDAVRQAAGAGDKSVKIKGNITASDNLNVIGNLTIEGVDGATLSLGQNSIVNNGNLTLANITVNGSITGNGTLNIEGNVTSNADDSNSKPLTDQEKVDQIGKSNYGEEDQNPRNEGYNTWKCANFHAQTVNIKNGANLTINRSAVGDGINLINGGTVNVADNAKLDINMNTNNGSETSRYHNAAVFAFSGGNFITGRNSVVNINSSIGQGIALGAVVHILTIVNALVAMAPVIMIRIVLVMLVLLL